jgi:hypothetical protein
MSRERLRPAGRLVHSGHRGSLRDLTHLAYPDTMMRHKAKRMGRSLGSVRRNPTAGCFRSPQKGGVNQGGDPSETRKGGLDSNLSGLIQSLNSGDSALAEALPAQKSASSLPSHHWTQPPRTAVDRC